MAKKKSPSDTGAKEEGREDVEMVDARSGRTTRREGRELDRR